MADIKGAVEIASRHYRPGGDKQKDPPKGDSLLRKIAQVALGKHTPSKYKRKMKRRKKKLDASMPSYRTRNLKRQARERYGTNI